MTYVRSVLASQLAPAEPLIIGTPALAQKQRRRLRHRLLLAPAAAPAFDAAHGDGYGCPAIQRPSDLPSSAFVGLPNGKKVALATSNAQKSSAMSSFDNSQSACAARAFR